ncbi:MAG: hypothetical protein JO209_06360 [Acidisphaera sp.]|nr:hypothetical protein [Acidisphaera sp.]
MLAVHPEHPEQATDALHPGAVWIDLFQASEADRALVTEVTGLKIPTQAELSEIETSSRLQSRHGVITMSLPIVMRGPDGPPQTTPVGFVLTRERLVTVRYAPLAVFDAVRREVAPEQSAAAVFVALCEGIVDRVADVLERLGGELDRVSQTIFHDPAELVRRPARADARLRRILREVGRTGELVVRSLQSVPDCSVNRPTSRLSGGAIHDADGAPADGRTRDTGSHLHRSHH